MNLMLPSMRQRLILAASITLGAIVLVMARPALLSAQGHTGLTITHSHLGLALALLTTLAAALPALATGLATTATGNPLSGVFVVATSFTFLAASGGAMDGWVRSITGPTAYWPLVVETMLWSLMLAGLIALCHLLRPTLRKKLARLPGLILPDEQGQMVRLTLPNGRGIGAAAIATLAGGLVTTLLLRSPDTGQAIGALAVGFAVGGLAGQMTLSQNSSPAGILFAPAAAAIVAYSFVAWQYDSHDQLLAAWFAQTTTMAGASGRLPGLAMALPIFHMSAGVAGCAIGIGLGQAIQAAQAQLALQK